MMLPAAQPSTSICNAKYSRPASSAAPTNNINGRFFNGRTTCRACCTHACAEDVQRAASAAGQGGRTLYKVIERVLLPGLAVASPNRCTAAWKAMEFKPAQWGRACSNTVSGGARLVNSGWSRAAGAGQPAQHLGQIWATAQHPPASQAQAAAPQLQGC
jgi:hypothetical protein